jgi:hypothetical protein
LALPFVVRRVLLIVQAEVLLIKQGAAWCCTIVINLIKVRGPRVLAIY